MDSYVTLTGEQEYDRALVGGKAWSVNHMRALGLPVPPAFCLTTDHCKAYYEAGGELPEGCRQALTDGIGWLEQELGKEFGGSQNPLLVSVRSGAPLSMPGMMDTVLNLGMTDAAVEVYGEDVKRRFEEQFEKVVGTSPPADPWEQLNAAAGAVFGSWNSDRAISYRKHHGLSDDLGTAVTVQAMVFGNIGEDSGTGVLFSRNPLTGDKEVFGEWLKGGQGEDVVSGRFDPEPLSKMEQEYPELHSDLMTATQTLEKHDRDIQDIEFTVEGGRLWLLQTRIAKRSAHAAVRLAVAMAEEGIITPAEALSRVAPDQVKALLQPHIEPSARGDAEVLATGLAACPGVAAGELVTDADDAQDKADEDVEVVLGRPTTDPDDVHGMIAAEAIVTELGGATSHAAVVSRELSTPCVVGCGAGTITPLAGQQVTIDGTSGEVLKGRLPIVETKIEDDADLQKLAAWAREDATAGEHLQNVLGVSA